MNTGPSIPNTLDDLSDFENASARIKMLESTWDPETWETIRRRKVRYANISVDQLRKTKTVDGRPMLQEDETFIPRRIADCNIRREQASYIAYITQSRDVAKFRPVDNPQWQVEQLEREFTKLAQYPGWQLPIFANVDGAQTHGWDALEVIFDPTMPGHFRLRHIGHELLLFEMDVTDLQNSPDLSIIHGVTSVELMRYVNEFDFNPEAVEEVLDKIKSQINNVDAKVKVHKYFYKDLKDYTIDGKPVIYVGWWCQYAHDWLKKPEPFYLGRDTKQAPLRESEYPVYVLPYTVSENEIITEAKGRVHMDEHDQEACTQLVTAFVNRAIRSTYILATPTNPTDDAASKQTDVKLRNGAVMGTAVNFFNIEPPDPSLLQAMMTITNQNANEGSQTNFAVANRKDSRKTATEIQTANQQAAMLNSVQVALLSIWLRGIWTRCWQIVQNRTVMGKLSSSIPNWDVYYRNAYILLPAGDVDVVRRAEIVAAMKQDWPVMQQTGAADAFLEDIIRNSPYAEQAPKYIDAMAKGNEKQNVMAGMKNALMAIAQDPQVGPVIVQKFGPQLAELAQAFAKAMSPPGEVPQIQGAEGEEAVPVLPPGTQANLPAAANG